MTALVIILPICHSVLDTESRRGESFVDTHHPRIVVRGKLNPLPQGARKSLYLTSPRDSLLGNKNYPIIFPSIKGIISFSVSFCWKEVLFFCMPEPGKSIPGCHSRSQSVHLSGLILNTSLCSSMAPCGQTLFQIQAWHRMHLSDILYFKFILPQAGIIIRKRTKIKPV
jgi:hypothetical protein